MTRRSGSSPRGALGRKSDVAASADARGLRHADGAIAARSRSWSTTIALVLGTLCGCGGRTPASSEGATQDGGGESDAGTSPCDRDAESVGSPSVVLFGGASSNVGPFLGDAWGWDGNSWSLLAGTGPSSRSVQAMSALGGRIVLFGGDVFSPPILGDTWEWDGTAWDRRYVAGPSPRFGSASTTLNGKMVLFGGLVEPHPPNASPVAETSEWDGCSWTQRNVSGPSPRSHMAMATLNGKAVLFGGAYAVPGLDDTWEWDGSTWTQRNVVGPPGRLGHRMATLNGKIVLFGGFTQSLSMPKVSYGDTWEWDG